MPAVLSLLLAVSLASPGPGAGVVTVGEGGVGNVARSEPLPDRDASYEFSVFRPKTHSVQKTSWYCVPTTIQMMLNLINGESDRSKANQTRYWRYAQANSRYPVRDNGADPAGWVAALENWGAGAYTVAVNSSMQSALREAAREMQLTGKPAGLVVWGNGGTGGHAWVMTGFRSTGDPRTATDFTVVSVQAMGSLWPYGTINGKPFDPGPKEWVEYAELERKVTKLRDPYADAWNGYWITVVP